MNLFALGYNTLEYLQFILTKVECLSLFVGIILLASSFIERKKK